MVRRCDHTSAEILAFGAGDGTGGFIETSSAGTLSLPEGYVSAGQGGMWLLDPRYITIGTTDSEIGESQFVSASTISASLNAGTNVQLAATGENAELAVYSDILKTEGGDAQLLLGSTGTWRVEPVSLPNGIRFESLGEGLYGLSGTFEGTPGTYQIVLRAIDEHGATSEITLSVTFDAPVTPPPPVNEAPMANVTTLQPVQIEENQRWEYTSVTGVFSDDGGAENLTLTFTGLQTRPTGGSVLRIERRVNADGSFTIIVPAGYILAGNQNITFTVSDGEQTATTNLALTVTPEVVTPEPPTTPDTGIENGTAGQGVDNPDSRYLVGRYLFQNRKNRDSEREKLAVPPTAIMVNFGSDRILNAINGGARYATALRGSEFAESDSDYLIASEIVSNIPSINRMDLASSVLATGIENGVIGALPEIFKGTVVGRVVDFNYLNVSDGLKKAIRLDKASGLRSFKSTLRQAGYDALEMRSALSNLASWFDISATIGKSIGDALAIAQRDQKIGLTLHTVSLVQMARNKDISDPRIEGFRRSLGKKW